MRPAGPAGPAPRRGPSAYGLADTPFTTRGTRAEGLGEDGLDEGFGHLGRVGRIAGLPREVDRLAVGPQVRRARSAPREVQVGFRSHRRPELVREVLVKPVEKVLAADHEEDTSRKRGSRRVRSAWRALWSRIFTALGVRSRSWEVSAVSKPSMSRSTRTFR